MKLLAAATGGAHGLIGGQALALFRAAAAGGAILGGADGDAPRWARVGELIGILQLRVDGDNRTALKAKQAELGIAVRELVGAPTGASEALLRVSLHG